MTMMSDPQLPLSLFADVRQRLGKRRYSPDGGRSPSPSPTREAPPVREPSRGVHRRLGVASQDSRGYFPSSSKDRKKSMSVWFMICHCGMNTVLGLTCNALLCLQAPCGAAWAPATTRAACVRSATTRQAGTSHLHPPQLRGDEVTERKEGRWLRRRTTPHCKRCGAL